MKKILLLPILSALLLATLSLPANAKGRRLRLKDPATGCTATLRQDEYGTTVLLVKDKRGKEIKEVKANQGISMSETVLNEEGFEVNPNFRYERNVVFAAWNGGGFDGFPQDYIVVRRVGNTYIAQNEKAYFRPNDLYCKDMIAY